MSDVLAGALGGLLTLAAAVAAVFLWWSFQDRRLERILADSAYRR